MSNPMIALILKHHGDGTTDPGDAPDEGADGWEAAAHDFIEAIAAKDARGVCDSFKALHDLAHAEMDEGDEGDEPEDDGYGSEGE